LLEYKRFKEAAQTMNLLEAEQLRLHQRGAPALELSVEGPLEVSLLELVRAFQSVLARAESPALQISAEAVSVGQRIMALVDLLAQESPVPFDRLFAGSRRRLDIIVSFLALLELLRRGLATARQAEPLAPIMIYGVLERIEEARVQGTLDGEGDAAPDA
ncbi:MAG TPA: segregation/condensation protein A, partial [Candidatus Sulfotelmatobacter sp.]|nr:segregation/condensation protein A [Candidatus Sulfotelmatobacter sp.]